MNQNSFDDCRVLEETEDGQHTVTFGQTSLIEARPIAPALLPK